MQTQFTATRLITDILTHDEEGIKHLITPDIQVTSVLNGGAPIVTQGEDEYLARIHVIWENVINYHYTVFAYENFTEDAGTVYFDQIIEGKGDDGNKIIYSRGSQTFHFINGRISSIVVNEATQVSSLQEYESSLAKVKEQKDKIIDSLEDVVAPLHQPICVIL